MATGSDILSYKGNAALAAGSDPSTIEAFGAGGQGGDPLAGVNATLSKVMDHQLRWNAMEYEQAVKDRDSLYETFASQDIDFPVEDVDRPVLQEKIDKIKKMMIAKPNLKADRRAYLEVQGEINKLTALKASAKTRAASAVIQRKAAAEERNPVKKERMMQALNEQLGKGVEHQIDPFSEILTYEQADLAAPAATVTYEEFEQNGIPYRIEVSRPNPFAYTDEVSFEGVLSGEKVDLPYKIKDFYTQQAQNPELMNADTVAKMNAVIDTFNTQNKFDPSSQYYAKHIAEVKDGQVATNLSPADFWKSFKVASTWGESRSAAKVDEDKQAALEKKMKISTGYQDARSKATTAAASMLRAKTDASLAPAQIELYKANAKKALADGDKTRYETETLKAKSSFQVNSVIQLFNNTAKSKNFKTYKQLTPPEQNAMNNLSQFGIGNDWSVINIGKKDETAVKALSTGVYYKKDGTPLPPGQFEEGSTLRLTTPSEIFMLRSPDGDPNKQRLIGIDKAGGVMKILDATQAVDRLIFDASGHKNDKDYVDKTSAATQVINDAQGGERRGLDLNLIMNRGPIVDNALNSPPQIIKTLKMADGSTIMRRGNDAIDPATGDVIGTFNENDTIDPLEE